MIIITDRGRGGEFAAWFQAQGATLVLSALGQGTAATEVLDYLGLEATEKAVLLLAAPPVGAAGAQGGPGAVAGRAGAGHFDGRAHLQRRRGPGQGLSAVMAGGGGRHG